MFSGLKKNLEKYCLACRPDIVSSSENKIKEETEKRQCRKLRKSDAKIWMKSPTILKEMELD